MNKLDVVGKSVPQIDAMDKAMGKTKFVTDLVLPRMLYGRTLRSPYPHAKIKNIDTSKAKALTGVKAVMRIHRGLNSVLGLKTGRFLHPIRSDFMVMKLQLSLQ